MLKFEDKIEDLDELLSRYRAKWQLNALAWMDYDDVCQIIRLHIYNKWHLWTQDKPFKPWASMVISNQIKNLVRNNYSNFAKPCLKCPHYNGGEGCAFTKSGLQDEECDLMAKWKRKKERAYNIKLPLPIDESIFTGHTNPEDHFEYEGANQKIHDKILIQLTPKHQRIYNMLYIECLSDEEVAKEFKFKSDPSKRKTLRFKHLSNLKKRFYEMAQKILKEEDIL